MSNSKFVTRRSTRRRSISYVCQKCGRRPMAMESYYCKRCAKGQ